MRSHVECGLIKAVREKKTHSFFSPFALRLSREQSILIRWCESGDCVRLPGLSVFVNDTFSLGLTNSPNRGTV